MFKLVFRCFELFDTQVKPAALALIDVIDACLNMREEESCCVRFNRGIPASLCMPVVNNSIHNKLTHRLIS